MTHNSTNISTTTVVQKEGTKRKKRKKREKSEWNLNAVSNSEPFPHFSFPCSYHLPIIPFGSNTTLVFTVFEVL